MKILLAIEPADRVVLEQVAARPWPADSSWEVLSVVESAHMWTTSEVAEEASRRTKEAIASAVERIQAKGWDAAGKTAYGDAKDAILDRAAAIGADFVIAGSHGSSAPTSAVKRFMTGNVSAGILRYAPCSVEIVRASTRGSDAAMKILLATDGSEFSEAAARSIAARPWPAGTEVKVLSVVELKLPAARAMFEPPFLDEEYKETVRAAALKRAQEAIATAAEILAAAGIQTSESLSVLIDPPKTVILQEAAHWGADLIVLGSHGHRGVERLLVGNTSEAVALHADCSVEIIRKRSQQ